MDKELELKLVEKYPSLYRDYHGDMRQTCMHWGFECGNGWFHIIDNLSKQITEIEKKYNVKVVADQTKEKFGGLRFYYTIINNDKPWEESNFWFRNLMYNKDLIKLYWAVNNIRQIFWKSVEEKISHLVDKAEQLSYKTCEICGKPGSAKGKGWIIILCDNCRNKRK